MTFEIDGRVCLKNKFDGSYFAIDPSTKERINAPYCDNSAKFKVVRVSDEAFFKYIGNLKVRFKSSEGKYLSTGATPNSVMQLKSTPDFTSEFWLVPNPNGGYFLETYRYTFV